MRTRKIALLGYTPHKAEAFALDPKEWDIAGLNDAYRSEGDWGRILRDPMHAERIKWFQIHAQNKLTGEFIHGAADPDHLRWLAAVPQGMEVITWEPHPAIPDHATSVFPMEEVRALWPRMYFNNSIAWMVAWAVVRGYTEIGLFGVDMATDDLLGAEYQHQRPSCEYILGWCEGHGITIHVPNGSDLLKAPFLYGFDNVAPLRAKMISRHQEVSQSVNQMREQLRMGGIQLAQAEGAQKDLEYVLRAWLPGDGVVGVESSGPAVTHTRHEAVQESLHTGGGEPGPPAPRE